MSATAAFLADSLWELQLAAAAAGVPHSVSDGIAAVPGPAAWGSRTGASDSTAAAAGAILVSLATHAASSSPASDALLPAARAAAAAERLLGCAPPVVLPLLPPPPWTWSASASELHAAREAMAALCASHASPWRLLSYATHVFGAVVESLLDDALAAAGLAVADVAVSVAVIGSGAGQRLFPYPTLQLLVIDGGDLGPDVHLVARLLGAGIAALGETPLAVHGFSSGSFVPPGLRVANAHALPLGEGRTPEVCCAGSATSLAALARDPAALARLGLPAWRRVRSSNAVTDVPQLATLSSLHCAGSVNDELAATLESAIATLAQLALDTQLFYGRADDAAYFDEPATPPWPFDVSSMGYGAGVNAADDCDSGAVFVLSDSQAADLISAVAAVARLARDLDLALAVDSVDMASVRIGDLRRAPRAGALDEAYAASCAALKSATTGVPFVAPATAAAVHAAMASVEDARVAPRVALDYHAAAVAAAQQAYNDGSDATETLAYAPPVGAPTWSARSPAVALIAAQLAHGGALKARGQLNAACASFRQAARRALDIHTFRCAPAMAAAALEHLGTTEFLASEVASEVASEHATDGRGRAVNALALSVAIRDHVLERHDAALGRMLNNLAVAQARLGGLSASEALLTRSLTLCGEDTVSRTIAARIHQNLEMIHTAQQRTWQTFLLLPRWRARQA
ncbi:uncharacterized protein AMSG_04258 [Thecamonas trahens ATCC 50062]|uniref:Uncharacterized protein n=1 Tax=Thecamonas trahens ATCC 50062 TaxID=461836 RepID=A0A0L0D738_THETB|nr:hypothetical protein AMSG_04258 [Thecamonas trahens ATCC 50062]KNC48025.1 hypothetical protein AMSG_04258 [Thecamonas trahens ATCC 50062]|eukprot:XP_013759040.1 hypothetical protein AMSG_04258 [Thecamonas trahens ATCC 50062]